MIPRRVLIVDDHAAAAHITARLFELLGHEVQTVHDGATALDIARQFAPEIVLLDRMLHDMDGFEVARRLRQEPSTAQSLLVALTGHSEPHHREQAVAAGIDEYLVKPADAAAFETLGAHPKLLANSAAD